MPPAPTESMVAPSARADSYRRISPAPLEIYEHAFIGVDVSGGFWEGSLAGHTSSMDIKYGIRRVSKRGGLCWFCDMSATAKP